MTSNPYLMFDGQCETALKFYEKCLGGKVAFKLTYGEAPEKNECSAGMEKQIMHARLVIGGSVVMASDCPPGRYSKPQGFSMSLSIEKPEEADKVFKALSENGQVMMPIGETFWALRFGMLVDQFDIPWMINCEKPTP
jgi:PhnB protein